MKCSYCDTVNAGDGRGRCVNCGAPYVSAKDTAPDLYVAGPWEIRQETKRMIDTYGVDRAYEIINWRTATG